MMCEQSVAEEMLECVANCRKGVSSGIGGVAFRSLLQDVENWGQRIKGLQGRAAELEKALRKAAWYIREVEGECPQMSPMLSQLNTFRDCNYDCLKRKMPWRDAEEICWYDLLIRLAHEEADREE